MVQNTNPRGGVPRRRPRPALWLWLAVFCCCLAARAWAQPQPAPESAPALESSTVFIDFLHPEAFKISTWIHVSLPSSHVLLSNLRIITANRKWSLQICGSVSNPGSCVNPLAASDPRGVGWRGDFRASTWSQDYQDLDATSQLHLKVTPQGGDWMIFRIQLQATTAP